MEMNEAAIVRFFDDKGHIATVKDGVIHVVMSSNRTANQMSISKNGVLQVIDANVSYMPRYIFTVTI